MFNKIKNFFQKAKLPIGDLITAFKGGSQEYFEEIEEQLILADISLSTTEKIIKELKSSVKKNLITESEQFRQELSKILINLLPEPIYPDYEKKPIVIMVYGVNGSGKTTSIAKLSHYYKNKGFNKILLSAADTFRAAADEQLKVWSKKTGVDIYISEQKRDPAAVSYVSYEHALKDEYDILIIDTAGRMHTNQNLMNEIVKIDNVLRKKFVDINLFTLLVIDGTTGHNAVSQAKQFSNAIKTDALFLTKIDGTAKGGTVISIADEFGIPVSFIGTGESSNDLWLFDKKEFIKNIF